MNQQMENILISAGVSLFVSLITFTLGLKAGKNQSDRKSDKDKYREISVHFNDLLRDLKTLNPKKWDDYDSMPTNTGGEYVPLLKKMKFNGQSIELNKKLIKEAEKLEYDLLYWSSNYYLKLEQIKEHIILEIFNYHDKVSVDKNGNLDIGTSPNQSIVYINSLGIFFYEYEFYKYINNLKDENVYIVNLKGRSKRSYIGIVKDSLNSISLKEFLMKIFQYYKNDIEIKKLKQEKDSLLVRTENIIKNVDKRVKEPFTFIETVFGAITDIFKF